MADEELCINYGPDSCCAAWYGDCIILCGHPSKESEEKAILFDSVTVFAASPVLKDMLLPLLQAKVEKQEQPILAADPVVFRFPKDDFEALARIMQALHNQNVTDEFNEEMDDYLIVGIKFLADKYKIQGPAWQHAVEVWNGTVGEDILYEKNLGELLQRWIIPENLVLDVTEFWKIRGCTINYDKMLKSLGLVSDSDNGPGPKALVFRELTRQMTINCAGNYFHFARDIADTSTETQILYAAAGILLMNRDKAFSEWAKSIIHAIESTVNCSCVRPREHWKLWFDVVHKYIIMFANGVDQPGSLAIFYKAVKYAHTCVSAPYSCDVTLSDGETFTCDICKDDERIPEQQLQLAKTMRMQKKAIKGVDFATARGQAARLDRGISMLCKSCEDEWNCDCFTIYVPPSKAKAYTLTVSERLESVSNLISQKCERKAS